MPELSPGSLQGTGVPGTANSRGATEVLNAPAKAGVKAAAAAPVGPVQHGPVGPVQHGPVGPVELLFGGQHLLHLHSRSQGPPHPRLPVLFRRMVVSPCSVNGFLTQGRTTRPRAPEDDVSHAVRSPFTRFELTSCAAQLGSRASSMVTTTSRGTAPSIAPSTTRDRIAPCVATTASPVFCAWSAASGISTASTVGTPLISSR